MWNNIGPSIEPWGTSDRICIRYFSSFFFEMFSNLKQTWRSYCENLMRSVFQSISYVEDSEKLLKDRSLNLRTHALCLHCLSYQGASGSKVWR